MRAFLDHFFKLTENQTTVRTELLAGVTTFSTMAYIFVINPVILSHAGMDFGAVMVATILAATVSTLIMALYAGYPFALAPGMGLNAFFAYTLVYDQGIPWQTALGASFLAGILFLILNLIRIRQLILVAIPLSLRIAMTAGIGLFLAFIPLQQLEIIVSHPETIVGIGNLMTTPIGFATLGLLITGALMAFRIRSAILISILLITTVSLGIGASEWHGLMSLPPSVSPTFLQMDIQGALSWNMLGVILALTFIAIFDAAGTITSLAEQGNFLQKDGTLPRARRVFLADAAGTMVGAAAGTSPVTTLLESAAGISAGGRTGLTGVVIVLLCLLTLFFSPLAQSIPFFATAPALIVIGAQMLAPLRQLAFDDPTELLPAFIVLITIPLTYSIATGISLGLVLYPALKIICGRYREVHWLLWILAILCVIKFTLVPQ